MTQLAIVSPCYNEEAVLEQSVSRLTELFDQLIEKGKISPNSFMMFVNDGSKDATWSILQRLSHTNHYVKALNLARNVGHQYAIMAGMMTAKDRCDAVITIDADLQDDLNSIEKMIDAYHEGFEVVYGVKVSRQADPVLKRLTAVMFYKLQESMGLKTVYNHADFRLMSRNALQQLSLYKESNLYLRGIIPMLGCPSTMVDDVIHARTAGSSKYTLSKMLNLALDGITSFSIRPIYCILNLGFIFILLSMLMAVYVIWSLVTGSAEHGWASIILSIWFVGGCILVSLGIIGLYVGKTFMETKHRPLYHIKEEAGQQNETADTKA